MPNFREMYPDLCDKCIDALQKAQILVEFGPDTDDPEAASMLAYDKGWFCGGYAGCIAGEEDEEYSDHLTDKPRWIIYLCRLDILSGLTILPLATVFDEWPAQGGPFDSRDGSLLSFDSDDWYIEPDSRNRRIGGYYLHRKKNLALECATPQEFDSVTFQPRVSFALPSAIVPEEWGF